MYSDEELENASHQILGLAGFEPATNGFLHSLRAFMPGWLKSLSSGKLPLLYQAELQALFIILMERK